MSQSERLNDDGDEAKEIEAENRKRDREMRRKKSLPTEFNRIRSKYSRRLRIERSNSLENRRPKRSEKR